MSPCLVTKRMVAPCDNCGRPAIPVHMPRQQHGLYCVDCCPACSADEVPAPTHPAPPARRAPACVPPPTTRSSLVPPPLPPCFPLCPRPCRRPFCPATPVSR